MNPTINNIISLFNEKSIKVDGTILNAIEEIIVEEAHNAYNMGYINALEHIKNLNVIDGDTGEDSEYRVEYVYEKGDDSVGIGDSEYIYISKPKKNDDKGKKESRPVLDNMLPFRI